MTCDISCDVEYQVIGFVCRCKVVEFNSLTRVPITEVTSITHQQNLSNIKMLVIDEQQMSFLPSNLSTFFPNLEGLIIDASELSEITQNDLKDFKNLKFLFIGNNNVAEISSDLFSKNPNIQWITFINNFTKRIGPDVFKSLHALDYANFQRNSCVNYKAVGSDEIEKLNYFVQRDCSM
jgi:Leucine-rich repeat (LRR) protein